MTLQSLFQDVLAQASEQDQALLQHLLTGIQQKQQGVYRRYINAALHMTCDITGDTSIVRVPNTPIIHNHIQTPHGGVIATVADVAMGELATSAAGEGKNVVTTNLSINYIATTTNKEVIAKGSFINKGRTLMVMNCVIEDETGRLLATASGSFFVIERRQ